MNDWQILNDTVFFTQLGIAIFGLAAMLSTHQYLRNELGEWDKGLGWLIVLVATQIIITISLKEFISQIGKDGEHLNLAFFVDGAKTNSEDSSMWLYVLSLSTNIWLILALKHIRPDAKTKIGRILGRLNWDWILWIYVGLAVLLFALKSTFLAPTRSFIDVYASSISVLMFSVCASVILWFREGKGFAVLLVLAGVFLVLAQGFLFGKFYPGSILKNYVLGSGLDPQTGISLYIVGRAGFIMSILSLSQTWLKIRLEEKNAASGEVERNWIKFSMENNELTVLLKMKNWSEASQLAKIGTSTVKKDLVKIAQATKDGKPILHESGKNYSRMRKEILESLNAQLLPEKKELSNDDLFADKLGETIFTFDADMVDLPDHVVKFFK